MLHYGGNATPELSSLSFVAETSRKCSGNEPLALLYCVSHCTSLYFVVCSRLYYYISNCIIIFNTTIVILLSNAHTRSSLQIWDATRVTLEDRFPKGFFLPHRPRSAHSRTSARWRARVQTTIKVSLKGALARHHRACYATHTRTSAEPRARGIFFLVTTSKI